MAERVIEHPDGTTERISENTGTTVIERDSGTGGAGILIGLAVLILVAVAAYFMLSSTHNSNVRTDAVTQAASKVGDAADKAGDAASKAVSDATK